MMPWREPQAGLKLAPRHCLMCVEWVAGVGEGEGEREEAAASMYFLDCLLERQVGVVAATQAC
jgi:hypothetical protein